MVEQSCWRGRILSGHGQWFSSDLFTLVARPVFIHPCGCGGGGGGGCSFNWPLPEGVGGGGGGGRGQDEVYHMTAAILSSGTNERAGESLHCLIIMWNSQDLGRFLTAFGTSSVSTSSPWKDTSDWLDDEEIQHPESQLNSPTQPSGDSSIFKCSSAEQFEWLGS